MVIHQRDATSDENRDLQAWTTQHSDHCRAWLARRHLPAPVHPLVSDTGVVWEQRRLITAYDEAGPPHPVERPWMRGLRRDLAALPAAFGGIVPPDLVVIETVAGAVPMVLSPRRALYLPRTLANLLPLPLLDPAGTFTRPRYASSAWVVLDALCLHACAPALFLDDSHFIRHGQDHDHQGTENRRTA